MGGDPTIKVKVRNIRVREEGVSRRFACCHACSYVGVRGRDVRHGSSCGTASVHHIDAESSAVGLVGGHGGGGKRRGNKSFLGRHVSTQDRPSKIKDKCNVTSKSVKSRQLNCN